MLNIQTPAPRQVLLRLPEDVASRLARAVAPRKRNQFLVDLLRRELEKEDAELVAACEAMNALEARDPDFAREGQEWVDAVLTEDDDDDFDREVFEREFAIAQAARIAADAAKQRSS
jgi:hypothetical protein